MNLLETIQDWQSFTAKQNPTHALTLKPNDGRVYTQPMLADLFKRFHTQLNKTLFGKRFWKPKFDDLRTSAIMIKEGHRESAHLHGTLKVHPESLEDFEAQFLENAPSLVGDEIWNKICPGGTIIVRSIHDADWWANYMFKEARTKAYLNQYSQSAREFSDNIISG